MEDILPQDMWVWRRIEDVARKQLESYGYREIRTPILEETRLFTRAIGEATDIVSKEMYTFTDRKGRQLTLRPEGTAPIARAYVEHSMDKISPIAMLYYIGSMFRSERPQKGRSRQFHQIGVEIIGTTLPVADINVIIQLRNMLKSFGLRDFIIKLNSLGCSKDKDAFAEKLCGYLRDKEKLLCEDCRVRVKKNVLRVLDCKNENCKKVLSKAPNIGDSLCGMCNKHFKEVKDMLEKLQIEFEEAKNLVRGLDYYTGTVFEVTHPALGSQDAIGAGGRYDNLVKEFGGPDVGAVGYALGIERIIMALGKIEEQIPKTVFIATMGYEPKIMGLQLAEEIRKKLKGITVFTDVKGSSLKSQFRNADRNGARVVIIIGEDELKSKKTTIRDMKSREQVSVGMDTVINEIEKRLGE